MQKALKLADAIKKLSDVDGSTEVIREVVPLSGNVDQTKSNNWAVINTVAVDTLVFRMMLKAKRQKDKTGRSVKMPAILVSLETILPMAADNTFRKMKTAKKVTGSAIVAKTLEQIYLKLVSDALSFRIKIVLVGEIDTVNHFYSLFPAAFEKHKFDVVRSYKVAADNYEIL